MRTAPTAALTWTAALLFALTACGGDGSGPDTGACRDAIAEEHERALASGSDVRDAVAPGVCDELDPEDLRDLVEEVVAEHGDGS
ncbi:hypothetical protein [Streptomyces sp. NPDC001985]|uniref:hypothetical protein n=1 Tax=Streptomyces sp. NPDC001985 TaxID=3154406 RepID=UPI003320C81F